MEISVPYRPSTYLARPEYRRDIDGLRAVAVLLVVGFHAFPFWLQGGFVGVDIFFVISGFLITTIIIKSLERQSFSFAEFYGRRIRRIFPALIVLLAFSLAAGWFILMPEEYKQLGKHVIGSVGFFLNFVLWGEKGYFEKAAETQPLLHLWSLSIEEQFYILWPPFLWFVRKCRLNLFLILFLMCIASFLLNIKQAGTDAVGVFYSPQTRFWELLMGGLLACKKFYPLNINYHFLSLGQYPLNSLPSEKKGGPEGREKSFCGILSLLGAVLITLTAIFVTKETVFPGGWGLLPTAGTLLIIAAGPQVWLNRRILSNSFLVNLGLVSYPFYLWHWTLLSFVRIGLREILSFPLQIAVILASLILAYLTYRYIEKPIRFGKPGNVVILILIALMLVAGSLGYVCYQRDGFLNRFPDDKKILFRTPLENSEALRLNTCFLDLNRGQNYSDFSACPMQPGDEHKPPLLLWGDSQAAQLYPGYRTSYGGAYNIIQRTSAGCPPIPNFGSPQCIEINKRLFSFVNEIKPRKIVLTAKWDSIDYKSISKTITELKSTGIRDIALVGPVPKWSDSLPKLLYVKYRSDVFHRVPNRMSVGLDPIVFQLDNHLRLISEQLKINYHSPLKILCNQEGCLTRLEETGGDPISWDTLHLTEKGSRFLVAQFKSEDINISSVHTEERTSSVKKP